MMYQMYTHIHICTHMPSNMYLHVYMYVYTHICRAIYSTFTVTHIYAHDVMLCVHVFICTCILLLATWWQGNVSSVSSHMCQVIDVMLCIHVYMSSGPCISRPSVFSLSLSCLQGHVYHVSGAEDAIPTAYRCVGVRCGVLQCIVVWDAN